MKAPHSILVTGCAGFIGSNFVKRFIDQYPTTNVVGIDDFSNGRRELLDQRIVFFEGSVVDERLLDAIFENHTPEYVFHFAALARVPMSTRYPTKTTIANIAGTVALLEKSRDFGVKRFIYSASSSAYGNASQLPTQEEHPSNPLSLYALQKYTGELFCRLFSDLFKLDTVCLRYVNVFGPGQYGDAAYATVICNWLEGLYFPEKQKPFLEGDGRQSRDFCFVDNVVDANILAMESERFFGGEVMNIGSGTCIELLEVKGLIEKHTGKRLDLEDRPPRLGDVRHTQADIGKARKWLEYSPHVDFETGLRKTIEWFEKRASS